MPLPLYRSLHGQAIAEHTVKKSRFIATAAHITSPAEGQALLQRCRQRYHDARHHCSAYCLGIHQPLQKANDDGEPSGTAGHPMLAVLQNHALTDTSVVVTRYFGGIKLGTAGLIRAYSRAVTLVLATAAIAEYYEREIITITASYPYINSLERFADTHALTIVHRNFAEMVTFTLQLPVQEAARLRQQLTELTAGTAHVHCQGIRTVPVIVPPSGVLQETSE